MFEQYGANIIAQNVLDPVEDESGHYSARLKSVLDHRMVNASFANLRQDGCSRLSTLMEEKIGCS
jgi:hypothetical protein